MLISPPLGTQYLFPPLGREAEAVVGGEGRRVDPGKGYHVGFPGLRPQIVMPETGYGGGWRGSKEIHAAAKAESADYTDVRR